MSFRKIEVSGFKSFADKLDISFDNGITAIVGPNGCGKSNVADAIRWVLGEQSSKLLRGSSMQDVIFKGSEKRKGLSFCEVALVFDNTDRAFKIEYDEVVISRKLFRSGDSEYAINRTPCRLKDVADLLHDSGIGRDGYSIIGQGKVEEIISSKPENRRAIFEEAAGIAKFKSRKVDAERKLERTRENLTRLTDIVGEIERQLNPLRKQAETAKVFLEFKEELKVLEVNNYMYQFEGVHTLKEQIGERIAGFNEQVDLKQKQMDDAVAQNNESMEGIKAIDHEIDMLREDILNLTVGLEKQAGESRLIEEKMSYLREQSARIKEELDRNKTQHKQVSEDLARKEQRVKKQSELAVSLRAQVADLEREYIKIVDELTAGEDETSGNRRKMIDELGKLGDNLAQLNAKQRTEQNKLSQLLSTETSLESRKKLLLEMQSEYEGYYGSVKRLLLDSNKNAALKNKIVGVVAELIKVPAQFETAIEMALGAAVQNVVTVHEDDAKVLVNYLKSNNLGRATFLPISSVKPRFIPDSSRALIKSAGCFGVANELITYNAKLDSVMRGLLGSTVIVENMDVAIKLAKQAGFSFKIVTLDGDIINPQGSITGGSKKTEINNILSREREISSIDDHVKKAALAVQEQRKLLDDIDASIKDTEAKIKAETDKLNGLETEIARLGDGKKSETKAKGADSLKDKRDRYSSQITDIKIQIATLESEINSDKNDIARMLAEQTELAESIDENDAMLNKNLKTIETASVINTQSSGKSITLEDQKKLEQARTKVNECEQRKQKLQERLAEIEVARTQLSQELSRAQEKLYQEEAKLGQVDSNMEAMQQRIWEEYELTYETAKAYRKDDYDLSTGNSRIVELKKEISRLGYVNVNAIEDSKILGERYDDLSTQAADLTAAEDDIKKIIAELSAEMIVRFETEFEKINANFSRTFSELFGGGKARLVLTESDDILSAGVDIIAEPPGKKLQNLTLLSGGEKALTAIAILFAILKLRPMPFCLLDEIEAALDEANVERFAKYLHRFAQETQFIVITHRKPTMELADRLYGVTMEEKGVSKIVSVQLSDAMKSTAAGTA